MRKLGQKKRRTVLLISGSGTTAQAVIRAYQHNQLPNIEIVAVVASTQCAGIQKAEHDHIPTYVIDRSLHVTSKAFGFQLYRILQELQVDLISQNGWLPHTPSNVVDGWKDRIINQHPGPLDTNRLDFGGAGMYGARVMAAVVIYRYLTGESLLPEATVHYVTKEFDRGAIIKRTPLPIPPITTIYTKAQLHKRASILRKEIKAYQLQLLPIEWKTVIGALNDIGKNQIHIFKRKTPLIKKKYAPALAAAKKIAITLFPHG